MKNSTIYSVINSDVFKIVNGERERVRYDLQLCESEYLYYLYNTTRVRINVVLIM